jgi:hypothetical protein
VSNCDVVYPRNARILLSRLDDVFRFCRTLGLDELLESSRFVGHYERIGRLVAALEPDERGMIAGSLSAEHVQSYSDDSLALTECLELSVAAQYLATLDATGAAKKLRLVLSGPNRVADEDAASNQSRNTLFEIQLAAQAWRANIPTHLGPVSDVLCEFRGKPLFIECKRPLSHKRVRRRIHEADAQLQRHLHVALTRSRGVVAISLSKLLNPAGLVFAMRDRSEGQRVFEQHVQTMAEEFSDVWTRLSRKVIGILFTASSTALEPESGLFLTVHHSLGYSLGDDHTSGVFEAFHDTLSGALPY